MSVLKQRTLIDSYSANYKITAATREALGATYTTATFPSDTVLVGYVNADIWVFSSVTDQDFFAFLEDTDGTGKATVITQFQLRGSHRALSRPFFDNLGLPWRANIESEAALLLPNKPVKLVFDPLPISYTVKSAHRIRLTIVNAYPAFAFLNPEGATISIYRDAQHASSISLPVITDPIKVDVEVKPGTLDLKSNEAFSVVTVPSSKLGKGYRAEDIDVGSLLCNGAGAVSSQVIHDSLVVKFKIRDLANTSTSHSLKLDVTGNEEHPMILGRLAAAAVVILFTFTLNVSSVFCINPIMACDPPRTTGIGAVSFTDGNGNPVHITSVSPKAFPMLTSSDRLEVPAPPQRL